MGFRLEAIDLAGFRGFNVRQQIPLDNALVIFYAPNGQGKSSLCEAIEWAIYGNTARKLRGERTITKREFENSLRNRFYPSNQEAYVALRLNDGKKDIEIRRVITTDEGPGVLYVDGQRAENLAALSVSKDIRYPFILQHAIRDFIFTKPGDRLETVSAQLGIGALTNFQTCLQNASRIYKLKSETVKRALSLRDDVIKVCSASPAMETISRKLRHHDIEKESLEPIVSSVFRELCDHDLSQGQTLITDIDSEIDRAVTRAFDFSKLNIDRNVDLEYNSISDRISSILSGMAEHHSSLLTPLLLQDIERERGMIELAKLGLPLITKGKPVCPLCGQTLLDHHLENIKATTSKTIKETDILTFLSTQTKMLTQIIKDTQLLDPYKLGKEDESRLETLLDDQKDILTSYKESVNKIQTAFFDFNKVGDATEQTINELKDKVINKNVTEDSIKTMINTLQGLQEKLTSVIETVKVLMNLYKRMRELVQGKVTSSEEIVKLQTLRTCLTESESLCLACLDQKIETQVEDMVKKVQDFSKAKRNQVLGAKSKEMMEWFSILNPGEDVKFAGMTSSATQINLLGEVFGEEVNVSSIFSEAQLNCLGLSFYAVTTFSTDNPFDFIVIDDPVQSMDQPHIENFKDAYLQRIMTGNKQVILLTHMQTLALSVGILYRHLAPYALEVKSYSKEGPNIIETEEALNRMLKDIHFYMSGDSVRRKRAGSILREFLERFTKELYRQKHGNLPKKYEGAMWNKLKELIHNGGLSLEDEGRVFESYDFCVNFPHDDYTKEPPTSSEIEAQYNRLKRLKGKYLGT